MEVLPPAFPPYDPCNSLFIHVVLQAWQFVIGVQVAIHTWPSWLSLEGWFEVERLDSDLRGMRGVFVVGVIFAFMVSV